MFNFFDELWNEKIIFENCPAIDYTENGLKYLFSLPEEMKFFINSVVFLFIVQAIIGLGEAIYSPAFDAVYSKHLDGHKSGRQWGAWEATNYFTTALGAIIGGAIVTLFGFQILFIIMAILCFSSALYIYHLKRNVL